MALRVLLADESATIKKVIQLALQDFGVEVKSVPVGLDVLPVARSFKPDVVFADVLLTKRNGYEVTHDLKNDPELSHTPVILMWSGFMELDQAKVLSSGVDRSLEKPFDPEQLRAVVKELVPHLQTNALSGYLQFPNRPEFVEPAHPSTGQLGSDQANEADIFNDPSDDAEDFKHVPLPRNRTAETSGNQNKEQDEWSQADLAQFRVNNTNDDINLPEIDENVGDSPIVWSSNGEEVAIHSFDGTATNARPSDTRTGLSRVTKSGIESIPTAPNHITSHLSHDPNLAVPNLDFERAEQILREQSREVLETVAWRILPDIVERIVREELQKLLKDSERLDEI